LRSFFCIVERIRTHRASAKPCTLWEGHYGYEICLSIYLRRSSLNHLPLLFLCSCQTASLFLSKGHSSVYIIAISLLLNLSPSGWFFIYNNRTAACQEIAALYSYGIRDNFYLASAVVAYFYPLSNDLDFPFTAKLPPHRMYSGSFVYAIKILNYSFCGVCFRLIRSKEGVQ
jgi:hypothetical protein